MSKHQHAEPEVMTAECMIAGCEMAECETAPYYSHSHSLICCVQFV